MWLQSQLPEVKSISCFHSQSKVIGAFQIQEPSAVSFSTGRKCRCLLVCSAVFYILNLNKNIDSSVQNKTVWCLNEQECTDKNLGEISVSLKWSIKFPQTSWEKGFYLKNPNYSWETFETACHKGKEVNHACLTIPLTKNHILYDSLNCSLHVNLGLFFFQAVSL